MPITPNFVKALKSIFTMLIILYVMSLLLQSTGLNGFSLDSTNSFLRVFVNQLFQFIYGLVFWGTIFILTKDKTATLAVMALQMLLFIYSVFIFSTSGDLHTVINSFTTLHHGVNILSFALFGLLHFRNAKGLYLIFAWLIVYGFTSGLWFSNGFSKISSLVNLLDLDRMFSYSIQGEEGHYRNVDFLRPFYSQLYVLFDVIIFWFVYSLIKAGKSFDLTLRTIRLTRVINQLTFSLIYWPLRILLLIAAFGTLSMLAVSFQRAVTLTVMFQVAAGCFSIFVVGSIYRNFLTDYMISKGRSPGWLYWFLNVPILSFFAWIYTFFIPTQAPSSNEYNTPRDEYQTQLSPDIGVNISTSEWVDQEEQYSTKEETSVYEGPPVYYTHPLQNDFIDEGRNTMIKIFLILLSIGLMAMQFSNTRLGFLSPNACMPESPIILLMITLALTIWYMFDWKAMLPLYFIQCSSILSIAVFQKEEYLTPMIGAGLVNMMIYYALFHFDHLKLINPVQLEKDVAT
jgi:hypothetical protein